MLAAAVLACFSQMESFAANRFLNGAVTTVTGANFDAMVADLGEFYAGWNVSANQAGTESTNVTFDIGTRSWGFEIKGGNSLSGSYASKLASTNLTFVSGTFTNVIYGTGNYAIAAGSYEVGTSNITIRGGTFSSRIMLGGWSNASTGKPIEIGAGYMIVTGGTFTGNNQGLFGLGKCTGSTREHYGKMEMTIGAAPVFSATGFSISSGSYDGLDGLIDHKKLILDGTNNATQFQTVTFKRWDEISVINGGTATIYALDNSGKTDVNGASTAVTKTGNGTLVLLNTNSSLTDGVVLQTGVLDARTAGSLGPSAKLSVTGNSTIMGMAAAFKDVTLKGGTELILGNGIGTLLPTAFTTTGTGTVKITGNLTFDAGLRIKLDDILNVTGALSFNGLTTVDLSGFKGTNLVADRDYELFRASTLAGFNAGNLGLVNYNLPGYIPTITNTGGSIYFKLSVVTSPLQWAGTGSIWSTASGADWKIKETGSSAVYMDGAGVAFSDLTGGNSIIQITSNVAPTQMIVNANTTNYTFNGNGSIIGSTSIEKSGTGTLTLNTANKFVGGMNVTGGTVIGNNLSAFGTGDINVSGASAVKVGGAGTFSNNVILKDVASKLYLIGGSNIVLSSQVSGSGSLVLAMDSQDKVVTVNGVKTYTGGTTLEKGTLAISALNALGTGSITINGGRLLVNANGTFDATIVGGATAGGILEFGKAAVNAATNYNKELTGNIALVYSGTSDLNIKQVEMITGNKYTYTGGTWINSGRLVWGPSGITGGTERVYRLGTGTIHVAGGATLYIHFDGRKTAYAERVQVDNALDLKSGSNLRLQDGMLDFIKNVHIGGNVTMSMNWSRQQVWFRDVTGGSQGNFSLFGSTNENTNPDIYIMDSNTRNYAGTVTVNGPTGGAVADAHRTELVLLSGSALNSASVNLLTSANGKALLVLATENAKISGLDGNANSSVLRNGAQATATSLAWNAPLLKDANNDKAATLTIDSKYSNKFDGVFGTKISIVKDGSGILTLGGSSAAFDGSLTLKNGSVLLGVADSLGAPGNLTLNVSGQAGYQSTFGMAANGGSYSVKTLNLQSGLLNISGIGTAGTLDVGTDGLTFATGTGVVMDIGSVQDQLVVHQGIDFSGKGFVLGISCFNTQAGQNYTVMKAASGAFTNVGSITLDFQSRGAAGNVVLSGNDTIQVNVTTSGSSSTLTWVGTDTNNKWITKNPGLNPWSGGANGDNMFYQNDSVVFGATGNRHVDIVGSVVPNAIRVTGDGYIFEGQGTIIGKGALYKEGAGDLTIKTNNTFSGGTVISGGRIILDARDALGTGAITFDGGSIVYGDGVNSDLSSRFYQGLGTINADVNGNNVTWAGSNDSSLNKTYSITDSAAAGSKGSLTVSNISSVTNILSNGVGTNVVLQTAGTLENLGGSGDFTTHLTGRLTINSIKGNAKDGLPAFTGNLTIGTVVGGGAASSLMLDSANTNTTRIGLNIQETGDGNGLALSNKMNGQTLYLNKLEGAGVISFNQQTATAVKTNVDLLLTEDTTWSGRLFVSGVNENMHVINMRVTSGVAAGEKAPVFTVAGNNLSFWNGTTITSGVGTLTLDNGAHLRFVDGGAWGGNISVGAASTVEFKWDQNRTYSGTLSGRGTVLYSGAGTLTMANASAFTGTWNLTAGTIVANVANVFSGGSTVVLNGGSLNLNNLAANCTIKWDHGNFTNFTNFKGKLEIDQLPDANGSYNHTATTYKVAGLDGAMLTSVNMGVNRNVDEASIISGIDGDVHLNATGNGTTRFGVSSKMIGNTVAPPAANAALHVSSGSTVTINGNLTLDLTLEAENTLLNAYLASPRNEYYIRLVSGALAYNGSTIFNANFGLFNDIYRGTRTMGDGSLQLIFAEETSRLVLHAGNQYRYDITSYGQIDAFTGVTLMGDSVLSINIKEAPTNTDGLVIRDVEAGSPNALIKTGDSDANALSLISFEKKANQTSVFAGSILGKAQLAKIGDGTFNVGGNVTASDLTVKEGSMVIAGSLNVSDTTELKNGTELTVNTQFDTVSAISNKDAKLNLNGKTNNISSLSLSQTGSMNLGFGANVTVGSLAMASDSSISVNRGILAIGGSNVVLSGSIKGVGTLEITDGLLTNPENIEAGQFLVNLKTGTTGMTVKTNTMPDFRGLSGLGAVELQGSTLLISGDGGDYSGFIKGSGVIRKTGEGTQKITGNGNDVVSIELGDAKDKTNTLILSNTNSQMKFGSITVGDATNNVANTLIVEGALESKEVKVNKNGILSVGNEKYNDTPYPTLIQGQLTTDLLTMERGGTVSLAMDKAQIDTLAQTSSTILNVKSMQMPANGLTRLDLNTLGSQFDWKDSDYTINLMKAESGLTEQTFSQVDVTLSGLLGNQNLQYYISDVALKDGKTVQVSVKSTGKNGILHYAHSGNSTQAAQALWAARYALNGGTTLSDIIDAVIAAETKYGMTASEASATLSAFAGSSVTALQGSQRDDLLQQVQSVRNRVSQMGLNPEVTFDSAPYVNAWVQANGGYGKLSSDGDKSGYKMDTWGATIGCDVDLNSHLTVGGALTANHSNLSADGFDSASGDNDGTYFNLFLRGQKKSWGHTVILTTGWNDASLNRTLNVPGLDPIHSQGSTSGSSFGLFYEATYDIKLNSERGTIVQPLASLGLYSTKMDGYTETGAGDASLKVDGQDAFYGRFAVGARMMSLVGSNIFGREALGEVRAQIVQDFGDEANSATVSALGMPSAPMNIEGSKAGRTGLQIGAGLTIPVGQQSSVYGDADLDIRSRQSGVTGNLGFRYTF